MGATLGSNSNKVWGKTSAALRAKDYKTAGKEKKAVEVAQRQLRAARDKVLRKRLMLNGRDVCARSLPDRWPRVCSAALNSEFNLT